MRLPVAGFILLLALVGCGGGLEPEPICAPGFVGVCGTLHFRGAIPPQTDNVFVAAYSVGLLPGRYEWVLAVWKKAGTLTATAADTALLRVAGYYRNPGDTSQAGVVAVANGAAAGNIDIVIDFDKLRPATDFVTCGP